MTTRTVVRRSPGKVRDAIVAYLLQRKSEATLAEIREGIQAQLGDVPSSSVRSYLNLNTGPGKQFERVGRGTYRLR